MPTIEAFDCKICGGSQLNPEKDKPGFFRCANCGRVYREDIVKKEIEALDRILNRDSQARITACKTEIWKLLGNYYVDSEKIVDFANIILSINPSDFWGKFYKYLNEENAEPIQQLISSVDIVAQDDDLQTMFLLLLRLYTPQTEESIRTLAKKAYAENNTNAYDKTIEECNRLHTLFSVGEFDSAKKRKVFLCYDKMNESFAESLTGRLEEKGYSVYFEKRNFFRGKNSASLRQKELLSAVDGCEYFLLLSTEKARDVSKNDMYFLLRQMGSRPEKKPVCIEYIREEYDGKPGEECICSLFEERNRVRNLSDVFDRLLRLTQEKEIELKKEREEPLPTPEERIVRIPEEKKKAEENVVGRGVPKEEREQREVERGQHIIFPQNTEEIVFSVQSDVTVSNLAPDAFVFLLSENNFVTEERNVVFFANNSSIDGAVEWASATQTECKITIHTSRISASVKRIRIAYGFPNVDSCRGNFSMVNGIKAVISARNTDFVFYLRDRGAHDTLFLAEFYRMGEEWRMTVCGEKSEPIAKLCWAYGIDIQ